ncbi:hypothetical protein ACFYNO_24345 [Kitasatospora sp. NPDC006697]|uniref:RICIN domain-containing protein n=1 Tax=Kitasatospora sp. NPDC006697 TaxID=3364020 RepID=UPI0036A67183
MFKNKQGVKRAMVRIVAGVVAPAALFVVAQTGTANAAWKNGEMLNLAKQQCLDGGGGYVSSWSCNGSPVQIWHDISTPGASWYQFQDGNGDCVDPGVGSNNGIGPCNGGSWQWWTKEAPMSVNGQTYYRFRNVHDTSKCLDGGQSGNAISFPCNGGNYQYWLWN